MPPDSQDKRDEALLVLVVDDATESAQLVTHFVQSAGLRALTAENGVVGISIAEKYVPDVVLLDIDMPGMDGMEVCRELKSRLATADIPVIFVTGVEPTDDLLRRAFDVGAHDVITKPVKRVYLMSKIQVILRDQALRDAYKRLATKDTQTGLDNRRQFFLYINDAINASRREGSTSFLILGDIDHVAAINDRYGYEFGDEVILTFARIVRRFVSPDCKVGRVAGDTIGIVLKHSTADRAMAFCRRIWGTFQAIAFDADTTAPKHFNAAFGIAAFNGREESFDADLFMHQADLAMFQAKRTPGTPIKAYWELDPANLPAITPDKLHSRRAARTRSTHAYVGLDDKARDPLSPEPHSINELGDAPH